MSSPGSRKHSKSTKAEVRALFPQDADDAWVGSRAQVYNMNLKIRKTFSGVIRIIYNEQIFCLTALFAHKVACIVAWQPFVDLSSAG